MVRQSYPGRAEVGGVGGGVGGAGILGVKYVFAAVEGEGDDVGDAD